MVAGYRGDVAIREASHGTVAVRRLRARIAQCPLDAAHHDRVALGELVLNTIERNAERDSRRLGVSLAAAARRAKRLTSRSSDEIFRGAFLVDREAAPRFDRQVAEMADREVDRISFTVVGPLAPWDFVEFTATPTGNRHTRPSVPDEESWAS